MRTIQLIPLSVTSYSAMMHKSEEWFTILLLTYAQTSLVRLVLE